MKTNSELIQQAKKQYAQAKTKKVIALAREKVEMERCSAMAELMFDEIREHGVNPESELGMICIMLLTERERRKIQEEIRPKREIDRSPLSDDFTKGLF